MSYNAQHGFRYVVFCYAVFCCVVSRCSCIMISYQLNVFPSILQGCFTSIIRLLFPIASEGILKKMGKYSARIHKVLLKHDDVTKWKHCPHYWPFVRGIYRSPVNSPHKGQWRGALMFSLICAWINAWVYNREAGDLRRHRAHYDVNVMKKHNITKHNKTICAYTMGCTTKWWKFEAVRDLTQQSEIWQAPQQQRFQDACQIPERYGHYNIPALRLHEVWRYDFYHYNDVIMGAMASQITSLTSVYSTVYSKHQSFASLAFVRGIQWWPVNSTHKCPVTRKMFPFDDVIMTTQWIDALSRLWLQYLMDVCLTPQLVKLRNAMSVAKTGPARNAQKGILRRRTENHANVRMVH